MVETSRPNFIELKTRKRKFEPSRRKIIGHIPTVALTPVVDGRTGAYEDNIIGTWKMVEEIYDLLTDHVFLPDGTPIQIVIPPEVVYGARSGALAQEYYTTKGVSANIWISRSWAYSDELMSTCQGIGSSEWQQAAYGLNQTNRPGAVWLKAFCAAMDEKKRPIFSIYNPDLENEEEEISPYVAERLLRFTRCAAAVAEMRGKNYLSIGGVSMGIIGSDVRRNIFLHYFGMGTVSVDMVAVQGRIERGFYDHEELERAFLFMNNKFDIKYNTGEKPYCDEDLLKKSICIALIVRDMMIGNIRLADPKIGEEQGFKADVEQAQGYNAIVSGTQGQRAWTDLYPNFDLAESILNSSFDWNGYRTPFIVATENDCKNGIGMLIAYLISGLPQLFADIRTNWTPESIEKALGVKIKESIPRGFIDKRNSGAAALDYAVNIFKLLSLKSTTPISHISSIIRNNKDLQQTLIDKAIKATRFCGAVLEYFRGDGLSSSFRTPGGIPITAYRYNVVGDMLTCSIVEGETVKLPRDVADYVNKVTDETWPEMFWVPRDMSSFEYMSKIGPNHDGNSFGHIGADLITLNAMLHIPIDLHNIPPKDIFRPTMWDRYNGDDFTVCKELGPLYL